MVVVLMGPSGAGKTTVGRALAARIGWSFVDADDLHPTSNVSKMAAGEPLDERDRGPWIEALARAIDGWVEQEQDVVLACSALRERYRQTLRGDNAPVRFVLLDVPADELRRRLARRREHFMPAALLESQLGLLEPVDDVVRVDAVAPVDEVVERVRRAAGLTAPREG